MGLKRSLFSIIILISLVQCLSAKSEYINEKYGFKTRVPDDWKVYAEISDDPFNNYAVINWGMPEVYSELEKSKIENAVSIVAYKGDEIKSVEDLNEYENFRLQHVLQHKELIDSLPYPTYSIITSSKGVTYLSKSVYVYQNDVAYVVSFTATFGTYDINEPKFDIFLKDVKFFPPQESDLPGANKTILRYDGLYVAKIKIDNQWTDGSLTFFEGDSVRAVYLPEDSAKPGTIRSELDDKYLFHGSYKISGSEISLELSNARALAGLDREPDITVAHGKITENNKIFLEMKFNDGNVREYFFDFVKLEK